VRGPSEPDARQTRLDQTPSSYWSSRFFLRLNSARSLPLLTGGRQRNRLRLSRLGPVAKMPFGIHPHMLRHSTGFKLANQGVDTRSLQHYLGHKNIQDTVRYPELSPERFSDFWKD
jgi:site-specific recombinase XerD